MIDIMNTKTFPKELEYYIMNYLSKLPNNIVTEIKSTYMKYNGDIACAIEDYLKPGKAETLYMSLIPILEKHNIIAYHATRLLNKSVILENGLKVVNWEKYSTSIFNIYEGKGYDHNVISELLSCIKYEFNYKGYDKTPRLFFFSGLDLIDCENPGFDIFCINIGGEIARWALQDKYPDEYRVLTENGKAFIIKFTLPFLDIENFRKETIAYAFVCYYVKKLFFNSHFKIQFDGSTLKDISPNSILDIIPYLKK